MGECIIIRGGGGGSAGGTTPILNTSYPTDVTMIQANTSVTFEVKIATAGDPAVYTYQWYVNNSPVSGATSATYTKTDNSIVGTYMIFCTVKNKAGIVQSRVATLNIVSAFPSYTYTGISQLVEESNYNWTLKLLTSGNLIFSDFKNKSSVDIFCLGGGGAGNKDGYGGGGGYYNTNTAKTLSTNTTYAITIGSGGTSNGAAGGASSAFGYTANGGGGGVGSVPSYIQCTMYKTTGSGIYVYGGTNVSGYDEILSDGASVQLACDSNGGFIYTTITISGQEAGAYKGRDGRYYRGGINPGWSCVYTTAATGTGASSTQIFSTGDTVSGAGANSGAANATLYGQGGAGYGSRGGSSFGKGGTGIVVVRNTR